MNLQQRAAWKAIKIGHCRYFNEPVSKLTFVLFFFIFATIKIKYLMKSLHTQTAPMF